MFVLESLVCVYRLEARALSITEQIPRLLCILHGKYWGNSNIVQLIRGLSIKLCC